MRFYSTAMTGYFYKNDYFLTMLNSYCSISFHAHMAIFLLLETTHKKAQINYRSTRIPIDIRRRKAVPSLGHVTRCRSSISWEWIKRASQTSFSSVGKSFPGCLFSKCCLYVFVSGICALQTTQLCFREAAVVPRWLDAPFCLAIFSAFFCCDWIFCCPRAIIRKW